MRSPNATAALVAAGLLLGCAGMNGASMSRPDLGTRAVSQLSIPIITPPGLLYTHARAPVTMQYPSTFGSRKGTATVQSIGLPPLPLPGLGAGLTLFSWGDASLETAARNGGVQKVEHVDYELEVFLFVYRRTTAEVYGD